jgi:(aminoalkyl)phosphonate N-acetyltransferase
MEQNFKIRGASTGDVDTIFSFISHLEERSFDFNRFKEKFRDNLDNPKIIYLVSVNDQDEVTGFISCHSQDLLHHEEKVFEIQEMYVARNYRDRGIGKALYAALLEKLAKADCESLEVSTQSKRTDAKRFYLKLGFVQSHFKFVKEL